MKKGKGRVFVGVSGGVDSSVSAALLKKAGYDVVGVFIKVWHPDFLPCNWERERMDAMRVCVRLGIPFCTFDAEAEYKEFVAEYLIQEYRRGRTPNPDVMCNKHVKFGSFLNFARERGADFIATGHYARVDERGGSYRLLQGVDKEKDQSYFLWTLSQDELKHVRFPIGEYTKPEVRKLAKKFGLSTAEKKDSQGICFLGPVDMEEFLSHYIDTKPGEVITQDGTVVGRHHGALIYTIGQRHGFEITEADTERKPYYVVEKRILDNILVVSHNPNDPQFNKKDVVLENSHWVAGAPEAGREYTARFRHRGELYPCTVKGDTVNFREPQNGLARGQSLVIYDKEECVGGGVISW
ncbi:MAG: tRNA 2-thiouridine(34) synthase MnmA [Candidatus Pacebacteria bacterium]|nr:tRNA 2-thiouridine(34) synthase MnmA [Candidatus Paceibacterota bacterium]